MAQSTSPDTKEPVLGQATMANSVPTVIASDQTPIPTSVASLPLPAGAATSANQTNGTQKTQVVDASGNVQNSGDVAARAIFTKHTDGTNTTAVKAASTAAAATDPSAVVALSPNSPLPAGTNVIGALSANQSVNIAQISGSALALGQTTMASSLPVTFASNQSALPASQSGTWTMQQGATPTALANAWPVKVTDGTNTPAVKAASTAAAAADPSLVVALSPNSALPSGSNVIGALTANRSVSVAQVAGSAISLGQKTMANSFPIVIASDQSAIPASQSGTWTMQQGGTPTSLANAWPIKPTDGTTAITVKAASTASVAADTSLVVGLSPNSPLPTGTNSIGAVSPIDGQKQSYSVAISVTPGAAATDVVTISGSATKTIRVTEIRITMSAVVTASSQNVLLIKRSAANSGGTSAAATAVPHDSNNGAVTASVLSYTANPTSLGAAVGTMRNERIEATTSGGAAVPALLWDFGSRPSQGVVLRGTAQLLAINLGGTSPSTIQVAIEWTEE